MSWFTWTLAFIGAAWLSWAIVKGVEARLCRTRRWCRRLWVVALILWVMLLAFLAWCLTLPEVEDEPEHTAQVDVVKVMVKWE